MATAKMEFTILYKNGKEEKLSEEGSQLEISQCIASVLQGLGENSKTILILGDSMDQTRIVRLSDVSRMNIELVDMAVDSTLVN